MPDRDERPTMAGVVKCLWTASFLYNPSPLYDRKIFHTLHGRCVPVLLSEPIKGTCVIAVMSLYTCTCTYTCTYMQVRYAYPRLFILG